MKRASLYAIAVSGTLFCAFAVFHASLVFIVNMPRNPIKEAATPLLRAYDGPHLRQGWGMFAPDPQEANRHVLVRAQRADGSVTPWYDASLYLLEGAPPNRITPLREIDQSLAHAALEVDVAPEYSSSRIVVLRIATAVIRSYERVPLARIQIQLEDRLIAPASGSPAVRAKRWLWQPSPAIDAIR